MPPSLHKIFYNITISGLSRKAAVARCLVACFRDTEYNEKHMLDGSRCVERHDFDSMMLGTWCNSLFNSSNGGASLNAASDPAGCNAIFIKMQVVPLAYDDRNIIYAQT